MVLSRYSDRQWTGGSEFGGSISGGVGNYSIPTPCLERLWGPPNLLSNGYRRLFSWR